jgi:hypothetical protein
MWKKMTTSSIGVVLQEHVERKMTSNMQLFVIFFLQVEKNNDNCCKINDDEKHECSSSL